ncbi:TlpA disulfide reductase family protein [Mucilaginibacter sp. PAMB04274]|uniref:TlpA family protein disulfide reductase n=1 Tax=Mucilaginibacter sp. PAMB04274 TaxID=3138568 RepID=UPI0031F70B8A
MKKLTILIVLALLCLKIPLIAQENQILSALKIGDTIPDINLTHILNYPSKKAKLSDFKGKVIILDFWATHCAPCIASFPKLDSVQRKLGNEVQILSITNETEAAIKTFLERYPAKYGPMTTVPQITEDKVLHRLFPHRSIPHYIWISKEGTVEAILGGFQFKPEKVEKFLKEGGLGELPVKIDIDGNIPLFSSELLPKAKLEDYRVFFKGRLEGIGAGTFPRRSANTIGICWTNELLIDLFKMCGLKIISGFSDKSLVIQPKDSLQLFYQKGAMPESDWIYANDYSVDFIVPKRDSTSLFRQVLAYINSRAPYSANVVNRRLAHLELRVTDKKALLPTKSDLYKNTLYKKVPGSMIAGPTRNFVSWFNEHFPDLPLLVDRTELSSPVTIRVEQQVSSVRELNDLLSEQGLMIVPSNKQVEMLVVSPNPKL